MVASVVIAVKLNKLDDVADAMPGAARDILDAGAKTWITEAKARVPVDTGALKRSIRIHERGPRWVVVRATGGANGRYYARWVEHGTRRMRAQPFFHPALDKAREQMQSEINQVAKRLGA